MRKIIKMQLSLQERIKLLVCNQLLAALLNLAAWYNSEYNVHLHNSMLHVPRGNFAESYQLLVFDLKGSGTFQVTEPLKITPQISQ
jgi:hypothetical protein